MAGVRLALDAAHSAGGRTTPTPGPADAADFERSVPAYGPARASPPGSASTYANAGANVHGGHRSIGVVASACHARNAAVAAL